MNYRPNDVLLEAGFAIVCPVTGLIFAAKAGALGRGRFEKLLQQNGWTYQNKIWRAGETSPAWKPYEPVPHEVESGVIQRVWLAKSVATNDYVHINWYDNAKGAQKHFESHGYRIVDAKGLANARK